MKKKKGKKGRAKPVKKTVKKIKFSRWHMIVIALTAFLIYANTIGNDYAQDDAIVITENMYTQQGIKGIPGLLTKDTFFGFFKVEGKDRLVAGGRYRPLTPIMFALENEIFGDGPSMRHFFNALFYALLCVVIYMFLIKAFEDILPRPKLPLFAFITSLIFALHPIHTEAVANIKGRDEIMAMMFGLLAIYVLIKTPRPKLFNYLSAGILIFLALMSKENAITLIPVAFLVFYGLRGNTLKASLTTTIPLIAGALVFLIIRFSILGFESAPPSMEMMNNPFVKFENGSYTFFTATEKIASIIFVLGYYLKLLIIPHPLTNDYYPRQVEVMGMSDPYVMMSLIILLIIAGLCIWFWKRDKVISFSIFYFFVTISIFANILFPIGTHMSERFLFMPSLGFCLLLAYVLWNIYYKFGLYVFGGICLVVAGLYSYKTITRNMVWKDDFTLYSTDVKVSNNSAKALNAAGGVLVSASPGYTDINEKTTKLNEAIGYLTRALTIHPNYKNAWLLLGNARFYLNDYDNAISAFDSALSIDPSFADALGNLAVVLREAGRNAGEKLKNYPKAREYLLRSYQLNSNDYDTVGLLGVTESVMGNHNDAIRYYNRLVELAPGNSRGYVMLSMVYRELGDLEKSQLNRNKALEIDPNAFR